MRNSRGIFILFLIILGGCGGAETVYEPLPAENRRLGMGLKASVQVMREESWVLSARPDGGEDTLESNMWEIRFNTAGNVEQEEKRRNGELLSLIITDYDTTGRVLEVREHGKDGKPERIFSFLYGENGRLEEKQGFTSDGKLFHKEFRSYDEQNRYLNIRIDFYERSQGGDRDASHYRSDYTYPDSIHRTETDYRDDQKVQVRRYEHDLLVLSEHFSILDGSVTESREYRYPEGGGYIRTIKNGDGSLKQIVEQSYPGNRLKEERRSGPDGKLYQLELTQTDEEGLVRERRFYSTATRRDTMELDTSRLTPDLDSYHYEMDRHGNWVRRVHRQSGDPVPDVAIRKFIYFPSGR